MEGKNLIIEYIDSAGAVTTRAISNAHLVDNFFIHAFCQLRHQNRTFYVFRIAAATDPNTGEIIENILSYFGYEGDDRDFSMASIPCGEARYKTVKIIPDEYFHGWYFLINKYHYPAFGVTLREYIDKDKTKTLRDSKKASGIPANQLTKFKITCKSYAVSTNPVYDFHEGDIFYSIHQTAPIQVISVREIIEAHAINISGKRTAFHLTNQELAEWLKTGQPPMDKKITYAQSHSEILSYYLE